jgi:uncharacterized protein YbjT (DUF2867 family)
VKVVVLGGSGTLGRALVARLRTRGVDAIAANRRTGVDLASGEGLAEALDGADTYYASSTPANSCSARSGLLLPQWAAAKPTPA